MKRTAFLRLARVRAMFGLALALAGSALFATRAAAQPGYPTVRLFGADYVDARVFAARFGLSPVWIATEKTMRLKSEWTTIELTIHRVELRLNNLTLFLSEPVVLHRGSLYLGEGDIETLLRPILAPPTAKPVPALRTIMIDAGHGGHDPGNRNTRLRLDEKTYTLDVARRLERLLKAQGFRVAMTRTRDRAIALDDRAAAARRAGADLFVSLHFNSAAAGVSGLETFVLTPQGQRSSPQEENDRRMKALRNPGNRFDAWNAILGYHVQRQMVAGLKAPDRGLKRFRWSVLRSVECPAVLVEAGFLSNEAEGRKVATRAYRQRIAEAVAAGVKAYAAALARARTS